MVGNSERSKITGPDRLTPDIFTDSGQVFLSRLTNILAKVWGLNLTSSNGSQSLVVLVYKKRQIHSCDNHRGINLTGIVFKILASEIIRRLSEARGQQTLENQDGYRPRQK